MNFKIGKVNGAEGILPSKKAEQTKVNTSRSDISFGDKGIDSAELTNGLGNMSLSSLNKVSQQTKTVYDIKDYYNNGHSAEETYNHFKETLSDMAKNDKEGFKTLVSSMLRYEGQHYDYDMPYNKIGDNQAEILEKFLTADGEVDNAICTTIHGFMMDTMNELGIKSSLALGERGGGHATLIYQLEDGKYVFNDYGSSMEVEADNVMDALSIVNKNGDFKNWGGYTAVLGQGSNYYEQYAFKEEGAYGDEIDSKNSNKMNAFTNTKVTGKTDMGASYTGNMEQNKFDAKAQYVNEESQFKALLGFQYKGTAETNSFKASTSVGAKAEIGKIFDLDDKGKISADATIIANNVTGYQNGKQQSFNLFKERVSVGYTKELTTIGDLSLSNSVKFTEETSVGNHDKFTAATDTKLTLEDGLKLNGEVSDNLTLSTLVNAGVIANSGVSDYANQKFIFNFGAKANIEAGVDYQIDDDKKISFTGGGYVAGNSSYINYGANAEITFRKDFYVPTAVYTNSGFEIGLGYSMDMTDIKVGGFNEKVQNEQNITARALFDLGEKIDVYGKYNYELAQKQSKFTVGMKYNFD